VYILNVGINKLTFIKMEKQIDILGTGVVATITGKITGTVYTGSLFSKNASRSAVFPDNSIAVDVKQLDENHIVDQHSVEKFNEETFQPESIKGDHYFILKKNPQFGRVMPLDDLKG